MNLDTVLLTLTLVASTLAWTYDTYTGSAALGSQVTLKFKVVGSKVKFLVEKSAAGFFAMGIGSGMSDADVIVIERDAITVTLKDCKTTGHSMPACTESQQNWALVDPTSFDLTVSTMKVEFHRDLVASGVDSDKAMVNGQNQFIFAYTTSNTLVQHDASGARSTVCLDFTTGNVCATAAPGGSTPAPAGGGSTTAAGGSTTAAGSGTTAGSTSSTQTTGSSVSSTKSSAGNLVVTFFVIVCSFLWHLN